MGLPYNEIISTGDEIIGVSRFKLSTGEHTVFVSARDPFHGTYLFLSVAHARHVADALLAYAAEADARNQEKEHTS